LKGLLKLRDGIVELYRKVATSLPPDVEEAIKAARGQEAEGSEAGKTLGEIAEGVKKSRKLSMLVCLEVGLPAFYVSVPQGLGHADIVDTILDATRLATSKIPLSTSAVDIITSRNTGDNTGRGFPVIHLAQSPNDILSVDLTLRCPECETLGKTYSLPDEALGAGADLAGIARCAVDAVKAAGGNGCPPYVIGIGAGAAKDQVTALSRKQLLRKLPDRAEDEKVAEFEDSLLKEINGLGIGPLGRSGSSTALGVKVGLNDRLTSSCIVDVFLSCWALRRGRLIW
jgi:tartrate/fumarate subfamily iron-sulfur-dependent hydro-lyase alpha chain